MNPMATSKADILKISRELIQQNGWAAVNIRAVAAACGVSVGCIYNYFGSKTELVSAAVESIWNDIFHHPEDEAVFQDTLSCIRWMYRQMEYGCQHSSEKSAALIRLPTASSRCGRHGSTFWTPCATCCATMPRSVRTPLPSSSPRNSLRASCSP